MTATDPPLTGTQSERSGSQAGGDDGVAGAMGGDGSRAGSAMSGKSNKSGRGSGLGAGAAGGGGRMPSPSLDTRDNPAADHRNMRRIIAEDPEWSLATVPLLVELCVKHIIDNFEYNSKILNDLLTKHKNKVLEKISTRIPIKVTANLVEDEGYWSRCCRDTWPICDVTAYGRSWKRMYFERNMQRIIENFVPEATDPTELNETIPLSANYIRKVEIRQLLPPVREIRGGGGPDEDISEADGSESGDGPEIDHFDFSTVLLQLPNLEEFHVTYGVKDCGMNFEWNLFQFTARDCLLLAKCIASCKNLKVFKLHRSKVDDDKVRVLISHILDHPGLIELDLSHNIISDRGARAVGKFLNNHSQLVKLNLADNNIRSAGAQAIAHALTKNTTLVSLDMRLNRLGDEGGQAVCRSLLKNSTLVDLNLASNDLTEPTAAILSQVVQQNNTLQKLNLACNAIGSDGGKQLQEGMEENSCITELDLRLTECGQESEYCINQILSANREKVRAAMVAQGSEQ